MDKFRILIGVTGIGESPGASFVSRELDYCLNKKDKPRVFVSRPDKYLVLDEPENLDDTDCVVAVIDPLPSSLVSGAQQIYDLEESNLPVVWLLNRDNPGVNHRELVRFLGFRPDFSQDEVPRELIARAEYNGMELTELVKMEGIEKLSEHIMKTVF